MPKGFHAVLRIFSVGQIGLHSAGLSNPGLDYTMPGADPQAGWWMEIGDWGLGIGRWAVAEVGCDTKFFLRND